jgi:hypothetical protein
MHTDQAVELATQLADQLVDVDRNEWKKWTEYFKRDGDLERALSLAQRLSQSPMLRDMPRLAYRKINDVIKKHKATLTKLSEDDIHQLLGFVGWRLIGRLGIPLEGRLKTEDTGRGQRGVKRISDGKRRRGR